MERPTETTNRKAIYVLLGALIHQFVLTRKRRLGNASPLG